MESSSTTTSLATSKSKKITVNNYTFSDWESDAPATPGPDSEMETD